MKMFNRSLLVSAIAGLCFTAVNAWATQQTPVALGSNSSFAILAGTTVTVTGGGTITGNIGISPGTAYVAGVPAVTVNGTVYPGGPVAAQAQADLSIAFNDAAGRQTPVIVSGNLGGQTLTPGLYKSTSSLAVSSGDLTLDAQGNANAVFIFQIASTLTLTSGRQVILVGNANPANIFWQVGSSATFGTTSVIHGNVLAAVSISVLTGATLDGRALAQGGAVSVDTGGGNSITVPVAPTRPTVTSTVPNNGDIGVPIGNKLSATFSTAMDPLTITAATFTLTQGGAPIAGSVSYAGTTGTFTPTATLAPLSTFTATITTGAKDQAGNAVASNYVWSFTTGATPDTTPPTVSSTVPATGATGVPIGNKLSATFSEAMDPTTINAVTFNLLQGATPVLGTVTYTGLTATFTPTSTLAPLATFTATITAAAKDLAGNALVTPYVWGFTTGASPDTTPPTVTSVVPGNGATGVPIGNKLSAAFSEAMDPLTVTTATFTLQQGATPVSGSVIYAGTTATFTPAATLAPLTAYTATITTGAKDLAGNALVSNFVWSFTTGAAPDTTPPVVSSTAPNNGANGVPIGNRLSVTFSEAMDPSTITPITFTLQSGGNPVPGSVTYSGVTATFSPAGILAPLSLFTATITTGAKDLAGNALVNNYVWTFTTGAAPDLTPPTVISTVPSNGSGGVPISNQLAATFSKAMDPTTITTATFILQQGGTSLLGTVGFSGATATFSPASPLTPSTAFTAVITTGARDLAGNALANNYAWSFVTGATPDTTPPTVISTSPANAATGVTVNANVSAVFSEAIDPITVNTATFTLQTGGGNAVTGTVIYNGTNATFAPSAALAPSTTYKATLATGVRDLAGNPLSSPYTWSFATAALPAFPIIFPAGTSNNSTGTINDASYVTPVAAGSIAAVFGSNLSIGQSNSVASGPPPTTLDQSSLTIGGVAAPIYFASPGQINLQIPWELAGQTQAGISATVAGVLSNRQSVNIAPFSPGIFSSDATGKGQGAILVAPTSQIAAPGTPATRGGYISIFCTGLGPVTNQPATGVAATAQPLSLSLTAPTVSIGGIDAIVSYSGLAPTLVGLFQVNAIVPAGVSVGNAVQVVISVGGITSNVVTIAVQ